MSRYLTIERRLALAIAVVALLVLFLAFQVPEPSTFMPVGPRLFPTIMGGAMLLSAVLLFILPPRQSPAITAEQAVAEHTDAAVVEGVGEAEEEQLEWRRALILMALTFVYVLLFSLLGFILSTAPFIVAAARILGSRHIVRDVIVGVAVAVGIYFLFTELLRVRLPPMPFLDI
jgi:putative tricarboxylic transport membrane protein